MPQRLPTAGWEDATTPNVHLTFWAQIREVAKDFLSVHSPPHYEIVTSPGVICAEPVAGEGPSEIRQGHHRHIVPDSGIIHLVMETLKGIIQLCEVGGQSLVCVVVCVVAPLGDNKCSPFRLLVGRKVLFSPENSGYLFELLADAGGLGPGLA